MGQLTEGSPLSWEETKRLANHVKKNGIEQFINLYNRVKNRTGDPLKWGDEVEYVIVRFDHENKKARVSLRAPEVLPVLREPEDRDPLIVKSLWRSEYGSFMIEASPGSPYGGLTVDLNTVEANLKRRRKEAQLSLLPNEMLFSVNFARLGCPGFTFPEYEPNPENGIAKSRFFPDEAIFPDHPRYVSITRNILSRRGCKVEVHVPIFLDENTPQPFIEYGVPEQIPGMIYLDATGLGASCCCVQVTLQASNVAEARTLYDTLTPLCPIMLALTASTPFYRGYVSDVDCRWNIYAGSVDCRRPDEREMLPRARCDSVDTYLSEENDEFNDIPLVYEKEHFETLIGAGVDEILAKHIAHLFFRDPVTLLAEQINQDNNLNCELFENIQTSNWHTMRFKLPPFDSSMGWRVEFRPCEVQLTDFENAAVVCFINLLTRVILSFNLSFIIPISKVDENMVKAQKRNAVLTEKFWFRNDIQANKGNNNDDKSFSLMTINEIINGKEGFIGLIPLIRKYLNCMDVDADTHCTLQQYMSLISGRATGEVMTAASWMRDFVTSHPKYKKDSLVTEEINYDLLKRISILPDKPCSKLLGNVDPSRSKTQDDVPDIFTK